MAGERPCPRAWSRAGRDSGERLCPGGMWGEPGAAPRTSGLAWGGNSGVVHIEPLKYSREIHRGQTRQEGAAAVVAAAELRGGQCRQRRGARAQARLIERSPCSCSSPFAPRG